MVQQHNWTECSLPKKAMPCVLPDFQKLEPIRQRIIRRPLGIILQGFQTTFELVNAMKNASIAQRALYEKAGILHRDISSTHIRLDLEGGGGVLVDWDDDYADTKGWPKGVSEDLPARMGTKEFMSKSLLCKGSELFKVQLIDNLESFFHILAWLALAWTNHSLTTDDVAWSIRSTYIYGWRRTCCLGWMSSHESRMFPPGPFQSLVADVGYVVIERYLGVDENLKGIRDRGPPTPDRLKDVLKNSDWMVERFVRAASALSIEGSTARAHRRFAIRVNGEQLGFY
ncbi:hypothetical protein VNI00_014141 [Paramarasmius palmivorus]|uniref:Fungal-type protein kinase domain-containing protein n=1 Tax=Paramarasmius palmivorus TaxID=297713 RepID=A0AAW0BWM8_9AGAR